MRIGTNRLTVLVLATLFMVAVLLLDAVQKPAAACDLCSSPGTTRRVYAGCCTNGTRWDVQVCSNDCCWVHQSYSCSGTCMF